MLLMSTVAEKFIAAQSEEGLWNAVIGVVSTLVIVLVCTYGMSLGESRELRAVVAGSSLVCVPAHVFIWQVFA